VDGGYVTECGCHLLDTICFLCGKPVSVSAVGRNFKGHGETPDSAALTIEFENGSHALANAGGIGTWAFSAPMYVKVYAENGEALVSGGNWIYHKVMWALHGQDETLHEEELEGPPRMEILRQNMMAFAQVVRDGIDPPCSAEDGLMVQRVIEAMAKSTASGRVEVV
jgi:predicted dehydrogenase